MESLLMDSTAKSHVTVTRRSIQHAVLWLDLQEERGAHYDISLSTQSIDIIPHEVLSTISIYSWGI